MFFLQMSGFPGAGKSTLARKIAASTGSIVLDHDIVKTAMIEALNEKGMDSKEMGQVSYSIEWALVDFHLSQGHSVILDSPCFYVEGVEKGLSLSKKHNVKYKYVECYLNDVNEIDRRLHQRKRMISQIEKVVSKDAFHHWVNNSKKPSDVKCLVVDTKKPLESYIHKVVDYLNEP
ncbi:AAA family ATPase [Bacillus spongiae]|uniref:AAA family ATPase n=1 Tax=Bacillus spongiae TaxID=2683610 RepID=A0ABU8H8U7_9BACI